MTTLAPQLPNDVIPLSTPVKPLPPAAAPQKWNSHFCLDGLVAPPDRHFHVDRISRNKLLNDVIDDTGFYLVQGPRRSGKSTMLCQLIGDLDISRFVYARVDDVICEKGGILRGVMATLSLRGSPASPEVREAALLYLSGASSPLSALQFLFSQDYAAGRKLVLFWDDFDAACTPERRQEVAAALRHLHHLVKTPVNTLPAFGGIVCLGAYNANLVSAALEAPVFTPEKTYAHQTLDFVLRETREIFQDFQNATRCTVSDEVIASIHELTGGHVGLVNVCGYFIQDRRGNFDLERWQASIPDVVRFISQQRVYQVLMGSLRDDKELLAFLRDLCHSNSVPLDTSRPHSAAQHLGLTKVICVYLLSFLLLTP